MATEPSDHRLIASPALRELPLLILAAGVLAFLSKLLLAQAFYIPSGSMLPQLQINDRVVVSKVAYHLHDPNRGDIVVFDAPKLAHPPKVQPHRNPVQRFIRAIGTGVGLIQPSTEEFIKRVVALPGETIDVKDGHVWINGHQLIEPYLPEGTVTYAGAARFPFTVPDGQLWVMGDNRTGSLDSRVFGPIPVNTVVGRTLARIWPLPKMSFL